MKFLGKTSVFPLHLVAHGMRDYSKVTRQGEHIASFQWHAHATGEKSFKFELSRKVSPWHDVPFIFRTYPIKCAERSCRKQTLKIFQFINEIPRGTMSKFEVQTKVPYNPIMQDKHKDTGDLRYLTYLGKGIPFNYGCVPQTWEGSTPDHAYDFTRKIFKGDNDPLDVVDVSQKELKVGEICKMIALGSLGLIDEGEIDWKILAYAIGAEEISAVESHNDHRMKLLMKNINVSLESRLCSIRNWFENYKTVDGKPKNTFVLNGEVLCKNFTEKLIYDTHIRYKGLLSGSVPNSTNLWIPDPSVLSS